LKEVIIWDVEEDRILQDLLVVLAVGRILQDPLAVLAVGQTRPDLLAVLGAGRTLQAAAAAVGCCDSRCRTRYANRNDAAVI